MTASINVLRTPASAMVVTAVLTGDSSYPAGGYPCNAHDFGFTELSGVIPQVTKVGAIHLDAKWDPDTEHLLLLYPTGGADTAPATPAAPTVKPPQIEEQYETLQREPYASAGLTPEDLGNELAAADLSLPIPDTLTPGGGKELPEGADARGVVVRLVAIGY